MKYINTYEETKILNYILSVNENNQINEGLVDRIQAVAEKGLLKVNTIKDLLAKGVLTAGVITTLLSSSPAFAKEYNKLDSSDKNKTEKFIKVDNTDSSDTTTNFSGPGGPTPPDTLKVDFSTNFRSGEYQLIGSDLQQMNTKLQLIKDFVSKSKTKTFKLIIHSSESRVRSNYAKGELAKLRGEEALRVINDYNMGGVFKPTFDPKVGPTEFDDVEVGKIGMKKAVNLPKYTREQYVNVEIIAMNFETPCNWTVTTSGQKLTSDTDYSVTTDFDVTGQVGGGEIILSPGGIPDRVQVLIDGQVVGDSGYFVDNTTSTDQTRVNFKYLPRYVAELTKVSAEKGMSAARNSSVKKLITQTFTSFDELVSFMLTPEANAEGCDGFEKSQNPKKTSSLDTADYMKVLKSMWGKGYRKFTFYDIEPLKTKTPVKVKFKLNGKNRLVQIRIFSPIGKTDYSCVSNCI